MTKYTLKVWKHGTVVDTYDVWDLKSLRNYYNENWKWPNSYGDCYCQLLIDGKTARHDLEMSILKVE